MDIHFHASNKDLTQDWREDPKSIEKFQFIYHFLPHPKHKRRANLLSHKALFLYCGVVLAVAGVFRLIPYVAPGVLGYASNITINDLFTRTNEERKVSGADPLKFNRKLAEAAEEKARHMFEKGYWAHISSDGTEPWDFILDEDYDYKFAGENLAKNFSTSNEVVEAWMESPSHKDNLLSSNYDEIGFAVVNGVLDGYETTLVVQMFGRPRGGTLLASLEEEQKLLDEFNDRSPRVVVSGQGSVLIPEKSEVLPTVDVATVTKSLSVGFGIFLGSLLTLDVWYTRKKGILKFNGHTLSHLALLIVMIMSVWFVLKPGDIL